MGLSDLMRISQSKQQAMNVSITSLTEERVKKIIPVLRQYISYWREYPDMFVEFMCGSNPEHFSLYFYQRV